MSDQQVQTDGQPAPAPAPTQGAQGTAQQGPAGTPPASPQDGGKNPSPASSPLGGDNGLLGSQGPGAGEGGTASEPGQKTEPTPGAPEKYEDFDMGAYGKVSPEDVQEFADAMKEANLTQEQAQKVAAGLTPALQKRVEQHAKMWAEETAADKELGGVEFKPKLAIAREAYDRLATPKLKEVLRASGLDCHPEFVRLFYRLGKETQQDKGVNGGNSGPKILNPYPNTPQMRNDLGG